MAAMFSPEASAVLTWHSRCPFRPSCSGRCNPHHEASPGVPGPEHSGLEGFCEPGWLPCVTVGEWHSCSGLLFSLDRGDPGLTGLCRGFRRWGAGR